MEEQYSIYAERLAQIMNRNIWIMVLISCVLLVLIVLLVKMKIKKLAWLTLAIGCILVLSTYFLCIYPYKKDISNQAYSMYTGEVYVEKFAYGTRTGPFLFIKTSADNDVVRYNVVCSVEGIKDNTTYYGSLVVAENSKTLVDLKLDEVLNSSK